MTDQPDTPIPDEADGLVPNAPFDPDEVDETLDPDAPGTSVLGLQPGDPVEPNEPA